MQHRQPCTAYSSGPVITCGDLISLPSVVFYARYCYYGEANRHETNRQASNKTAVCPGWRFGCWAFELLPGILDVGLNSFDELMHTDCGAVQLKFTWSAISISMVL